MHVAEIMTSASVTESPGDTVTSAAEMMWREQTGSLLVMEGETLLGIITERDVVKALAKGNDPARMSVNDAMTRDVVTVPPDMTLHDAARLMAVRWIRHLPVVDDGRVVGVVSQRDLVGVFAALAPDVDAGVELPNDELVRSRRLARIEHGDLD
ncbi:MAG: CBS domain-containing protein [Mycobacteriales bacterium]|nr:CBS domain-containing protein [Frankia sp.]